MYAIKLWEMIHVLVDMEEVTSYLVIFWGEN